MLEAALMKKPSILYSVLTTVREDQMNSVMSDENDNKQSVLLLCRLSPTMAQVAAHCVRLLESGRGLYPLPRPPTLLLFSIAANNMYLTSLEKAMSGFSVTLEHHSRLSAPAIRKRVRQAQADSSTSGLIVILGTKAVSADELLPSMYEEALKGKPKVRMSRPADDGLSVL